MCSRASCVLNDPEVKTSSFSTELSKSMTSLSQTHSSTQTTGKNKLFTRDFNVKNSLFLVVDNVSNRLNLDINIVFRCQFSFSFTVVRDMQCLPLRGSLC